MAESKDYTGGCHCGANKFEVKLSPPVGSPERKLSNCNCSMCSRNGYIFLFVSEADMNWTKGGFGSMTEYKFNTEKYKHYFCPTCGTSVAINAESMGVALNARTLDDVDVNKLVITKTVDGKNF